jgi:hypothetical protein
LILFFIISDIQNIEKLTNLKSIVFDNNQIKSIKNFPNLTNIDTIWLNNNELNDLNECIDSLIHLKNLKNLSLTRNPLAPSQFLDPDNYQNFRYFIIFRLKNLKFLDSIRISNKEINDSLKFKDKFIIKPSKNIKNDDLISNKNITTNTNKDVVNTKNDEKNSKSNRVVDKKIDNLFDDDDIFGKNQKTVSKNIPKKNLDFDELDDIFSSVSSSSKKKKSNNIDFDLF